jgi:hypothetical protein
MAGGGHGAERRIFSGVDWSGKSEGTVGPSARIFSRKDFGTMAPAAVVTSTA